MNIKNYLRLFNKVVNNGMRQGDKYELEQIMAWHDFDGYTCYLGYKDVTMSIYFHNKYEFDYQDKHSLQAFHKLAEQQGR